MTVMGVAKFERFFRSAAGISVDKDDLKRYSDFIQTKLYDMLIVGEAKARANDRGIIEPWDLPVTKGLQESMHRYRKLDEEVELQPILAQLATLPRLDLEVSDDTNEELPTVVGGLSCALAATIKAVDPGAKQAHAHQWEQAFRIFDLLL